MKELIKSGNVPTDKWCRELQEALTGAFSDIMEIKLGIFMDYLKESRDAGYSVVQTEREFSDCIKEYLKLVREDMTASDALIENGGKIPDTALLNPAGEYAVKFAENHGISLSGAMEQPVVKARLDFFNQTGR